MHVAASGGNLQAWHIPAALQHLVSLPVRKAHMHPVQGPEIAIHHSEEVLAAMNEWCLEHHGPSGLTERCRQSGTSLAQAEQQAGLLTSPPYPISQKLPSVHVSVGAMELGCAQPGSAQAGLTSSV